MSRNGILAVIAVIVLGAIGYVALQENNEGPLEEAGEELDDATDEIGDSVEDAAEDIDDPNEESAL